MLKKILKKFVEQKNQLDAKTTQVPNVQTQK